MEQDQEVIEGIRLIRVIDGDTLRILVPGAEVCGVQNYNALSCRLFGVDAPEKSTEAGKQVTKITQRLFPHWEIGTLTIINNSDKYAGRLDGKLLVKGTDLSAFLLEHQLVKPYEGGTRSWTMAELREIEEKAKLMLSQVSYVDPYM